MLIFITVLTCSHIEIEHGSAIVDSYDVGSEARIECDRGYELEGSSSTMICLSTGRWSYIHRLPTCNGECTGYIYFITRRSFLHYLYNFHNACKSAQCPYDSKNMYT